jgi:glutathione S-transferase
MITISAFKWVPPFARGLVRDLRVRWALEEAGIAYHVRLIDPEIQKSADYRSWQPFGQVPALEEDGKVIFESGAILLSIAERSEALLPHDPEQRARAITWVFAALNSIEPRVQQLTEIDLFNAGREWTKERRPEVAEALETRLTELATWIGDRDYLEERFTIGDLMMTTVLRIPRHVDVVERIPNLAAYKARCEARPAFQRALAGQMSDFVPDGALPLSIERATNGRPVATTR